MSQLTFTNLTTNGVLDAKKTELLSYFITCGKPLVVEQLMERFPRTREATLTKACDTLVNMLYLNVEKKVDVDGVESGLYSLNTPIVKELLRRNNETLDDDLGQQLAAVQRILSEPDEGQTIQITDADPNSADKNVNGSLQNVNLSETTEADLKSVGTFFAPANTPQTDGAAQNPITVNSDSGSAPADPEPTKRGRKPKNEVAQLIAMSEDDMYNTVRAAATDIIAASAERYPQVIGLNPDVCAEAFINHYSSKGWMVGKNKMVDWRAALRNAIREPWTSMARNKQYTQSDLALRMAAEGAKMDAIFGPAKPVTPQPSAPNPDFTSDDLADDDWMLKFYGFNPDGTPINKSASSSPASSSPALIEGHAQTISEEELARQDELREMEEMAAMEQSNYEEEGEEDEEGYY